MGWLVGRSKSKVRGSSRDMITAHQRLALASALMLCSISIALFAFTRPTLSQSGRQKTPTPTPSQTNSNSRPRQISTRSSQPIAQPTPKQTPVVDDTDEVVRVISNLVAVRNQDRKSTRLNSSHVSISY